MSLIVLAGYGLEDRRRSGHTRVEMDGSGTHHLMGTHVRWVILKSSENQWPPGSVSPSFKVWWARDHIHCTDPEGSPRIALCVRHRPACMACGVELNHPSFTHLPWDWGHLILWVSLSSPPAAPSYLLFPGYPRLEKDIAMGDRWCLWTIQLRPLLTDSWLPWELTTGKPSSW